MINLTQNKKLQIYSDTSGLNWSTSWTQSTIDCANGCVPCYLDRAAQGDTVNGTVDIIPVPSTNTNTKTFSNGVEYISVYNSTLSNAVVSVQVDSSGTPKIIFKLVLSAGYTLIYNEDSGWAVYDSTGNVPPPSPTFDDMTYIPLSGTDTYTGTLPGLISYTQILNKSIGVYPLNSNTTASTFNFNGLGAIPVKKFGNVDVQGPSDGVANPDLKANQRYICVYDGANFQIITITDNIVDAE